MSENAENVVNDEPQPAEDKQAEPMVPKYRLDEQASQINFLKETIKLQQEALGQVNRQVRQPQDPAAEIEELKDLDPALLRGIKRLIGGEIQNQAQPLRAALGSLANRTEEQGFVNEYGKESKKYLAPIRQKIQEYAQKGMPLDMEMAYKMIRFDEMESSPKKAPKQVEAPVESAPATPPPAQKGPAKAFNELSIEEMEAQLEGKSF